MLGAKENYSDCFYVSMEKSPSPYYILNRNDKDSKKIFGHFKIWNLFHNLY